MQPIITPEESARLDAAAPDPVEVLMDRAGLGVALAAVRMGVGYGSRVCVLAGPGNNGGDGYVAARYLARRGVHVCVHALGFPKGEHSPARRAGVAAAAAGVRMHPVGEIHRADLIVDAMFGAGFRGELPPEASAWTDAPDPVLAVDVPSGLDAATGAVSGAAMTAARTVTFHARKVGHLFGEGPERSGVVEVVDIGLDPAGATRAELMMCEEADALRPTRTRTAHKWSAGAVLVVGGSPGITGAPLLAATTALNFGAGSAAVACPGALASIYEAMAPGVMTAAVGKGERFAPGDAGEVLKRAARYDVIALGPGLGPDQHEFVAAVVAGWEGGLVVDADGLNSLPGAAALAARAGDTVVTPHSGEFRRISGAEPGYHAAGNYAGESRSTVVLKGNPTVVAGAERWVVTSGGPELATIGTGDVLTGMIAALWARGLGVEAAARAGAYWHGRAGAALAADGAVTAERLATAVAQWAGA